MNYFYITKISVNFPIVFFFLLFYLRAVVILQTVEDTDTATDTDTEGDRAVKSH